METLTWFLAISSVSLGFLSVVLSILLTHITNKTIKSEDARAKELIERMERGIRETIERMDIRAEQSAKETKELLQRMDERTESLLRHISDLIAAEGEKTRELIKMR